MPSYSLYLMYLQAVDPTSDEELQETSDISGRTGGREGRGRRDQPSEEGGGEEGRRRRRRQSSEEEQDQGYVCCSTLSYIQNNVVPSECKDLSQLVVPTQV